MSKRTITQLPPLDVVKFLFPGKWFRWTAIADYVFKYDRAENGELVLFFRRHGNDRWIQATGDRLRLHQQDCPKNFVFVKPVKVEIDDDDDT